MRALPLVVLLAGCSSFRPLADGGALDLAGADLAGADLAPGPGGMGPGPLGALPSGFCCSSSEQCRSRLCAQLGGGPYYCSDPCAADATCTGWTTQYTCDAQLMKCAPVNDPYTCADGAGFTWGGSPTGACCDPNAARAGATCQGGLCLSVGGNPGFCSQGCSAQSPCPAGYACNDTVRQCWKSVSIGDPMAPYTCG